MAVVSVAGFGAATGDAGDDTAAIRAAIAASRDGDTILFPAGQYLLSDTIALASNRTYLGEPGAVLNHTGDSGDPLMRIHDGRSVTVTGLTFEGHGIALDGALNDAIHIDGNAFQNIFAEDFGDADGVYSTGRLTNSTISYNRFANIGVRDGRYAEDSVAIRGYHLDHTTILGNSFDTVNQGMSLVWDTMGGDAVTIENNTGLRVHRMGIEALGDAAVTNLVVRNNRFGEFLDPWGGSFGLSIVVDGSQGTLIEGNELSATAPAEPGEHYGFGIEAGGMNPVIQNNSLFGDWYSAVAVGNGPGAVVQNNRIEGGSVGPLVWFYGSQ